MVTSYWRTKYLAACPDIVTNIGLPRDLFATPITQSHAAVHMTVNLPNMGHTSISCANSCPREQRTNFYAIIRVGRSLVNDSPGIPA